MKIAILYVSSTGNTETAAGYIREGLQQAGELDVRLMKLNADEPLDAAYIEDCAAVLVGTPPYVATMCWQLKKWFDTDKNARLLAGKLGGAFSTARYIHGGGDIAVSDVLHHLLCRGMVVYSSGGAFGHPVIHLGPVAIDGDLEAYRELFVEYGKRFGNKALELFGQ
jgi:NAD(P)H dehydrogenase (quinone)